MNSDFMKWTLNVGRVTQSLRILSRDSACCMKTLAELERAIPQFHRQPALARELDSKLTAIIHMLDTLAKELEYPVTNSCQNVGKVTEDDDEDDEGDEDYDDD